MWIQAPLRLRSTLFGRVGWLRRTSSLTLKEEYVDSSTSKPSGYWPASDIARAWPARTGVNISGLFAWWMWRTIYLSKLPRLEKELRRGARLDTRSSIFERSLPVYRCSIGAPYEQ